MFTEGEAYHCPTVFELNAVLYHVGLLTERGREPKYLDPTADLWQLRHPVVEPYVV